MRWAPRRITCVDYFHPIALSPEPVPWRRQIVYQRAAWDRASYHLQHIIAGSTPGNGGACWAALLGSHSVPTGGP